MTVPLFDRRLEFPMTKQLIQTFIHKRAGLTAKEQRQRYGLLSGGMGIGLNILLSIIKIWAGFITNSLSILADGVNNLTDVGSSVVTLLGFHLSNKKPDPEHPFGHGRMEYLSGLIVSIFIFLVGFELLQASVTKIIAPNPTTFNPMVFGILVISIVIKLWMSHFNTILAREISSPVLRASAIDARSDAMATTAVLVSALIAEGTSLALDGPIGLLVALLILKTGWSTLQDTIDPILGKPPTPELIQSIYTCVLSKPLITGLHDLIIHDYGPGRSMMSLHVEVAMTADIMEVHDIIDQLERELYDQFDILTSIHTDPIATDDPRFHALRDEISQLVCQIDSALSIHDFRTTLGPDHTNMIFDITVPHTCTLTDDQLRSQVTAAVTTLDPSYRAILLLDRTYL